MKTVLRIIDRKGSEYIDIPNPYSMIPRKEDHYVWEAKSYIVSWVEFDFDNNTLYIVTVNS